MSSVIILGRQPAIGIAELEALFSAEKTKPLSNESAILDINPADIPFNRLGGSLKAGELIGETASDTTVKFLYDYIKNHVSSNKKVTVGISYYGHRLTLKRVNALALNLKKQLKQTGVSCRIVPNKQPALNTAQVIHNKLTSDKGIEFLLIESDQKLVIGKTTAVQNIDAYAARDQARPKRDSRVGMLPPKLAQVLINLASGSLETHQTLLDPFCGTGVVLQEALLMGFNVAGSDIDPKMIDYTKTNLEWLDPSTSNRIQSLLVGDATALKWTFDIGLVASETYLGPPLSRLPEAEKLEQILSEINHLHKQFLINLHGQLRSGTRVTLAMPAWKTETGFLRLPVLDQLPLLGYNQVAFKNAKAKELIYHRPQQLVARELVTIVRI